jgi:hypothetical protein
MPVRLKQAYNGSAAGTLYWGSDEAYLLATGLADTFIEQATDYAASERIVTSATASTTHNALVYRMNSASPQVLTLKASSFPPGTITTVIQEGAGATTIAPDTNVTINTALPGLVTQGQYKVAQFIKLGNPGQNIYVAIGSLGT